MKQSVIAILFFALLGCTEENDPQSDTALAGVWVDEVTESDTLEFLKFEDGSSLMNLNRGKEFANGYNLPKVGSGLYTFSIEPNSISLNYTLSSDSRRLDYFFHQTGGKLEIGKFFKSDNPASILVFRKVK